MLFSEIYGNYYNAIASILDEALEHPATPARIREIVDEKAFAESILTIPEELAQGGKWPLLDEEGYSLLSKETYMPLTTLQKRWLKTLLLDPRIRLFAPDEKGLKDVEPLYDPKDVVYFDQFSDGDPYEEETYIHIFRTILGAVKKHQSIRILDRTGKGTKKDMLCNPLRIEYSLRDDKFRLISICNHLVTTTNIAGIEECKVLEVFDETGRKAKLRERKKVELILKDEREALQRFMIQFSIYEKITQKIGEGLYQCALSYEAEDETDILIRILSFGPNIKVTGPEDFVKNIRRRLECQRDISGNKASE